MAISKQDFVVLDLGSQVIKGASFVTLASSRARVLSFGEEDLGPREGNFTLEDKYYSQALLKLLQNLTRGEKFSLILALPLHHLVWFKRSVAYRRQGSLEALTSQELKNLFFYLQSRLIEKIKKVNSELFFVAAALSSLTLDGKPEVLSRKGRGLELSLIQAFAPRSLLDFVQATFPQISREKISFFCFPLGLKGGKNKLLLIDSGAAKLSLTEVRDDLVEEVLVLPWGGLDLTYALLKKGESLLKAEERKKEGKWPKEAAWEELLEAVLSFLPSYDEATETLLAGRSWSAPWELELKKKLSGNIFWEKELNYELGLPEKLPLSLSAAMRFSLFSETETPQRLFQRVAALSAR